MEAKEVTITARDIQIDMRSYRRAQQYVMNMEPGQLREDLENLINMGANLILEEANNLGFTEMEELRALEQNTIITYVRR